MQKRYPQAARRGVLIIPPIIPSSSENAPPPPITPFRQCVLNFPKPLGMSAGEVLSGSLSCSATSGAGPDHELGEEEEGGRGDPRQMKVCARGGQEPTPRRRGAGVTHSR